MKIPLSAYIAGVSGSIILIGYYIQLPVLMSIRMTFLLWAFSLSAFALLVGLMNLCLVHWRKLTAFKSDSLYSGVLIISLITTFSLGMIYGPYAELPAWIFNNIQVPIEMSLMAIISISLVFSAARLILHRANTLTLIFLTIVLISLVGMGGFFGTGFSIFSDWLRPWIAQVPATAGARGILLGIALGTVATGLRILTGSDRPYEK